MEIDYDFGEDELAWAFFQHWSTCKDCKRNRAIYFFKTYGLMLLVVAVLALLFRNWFSFAAGAVVVVVLFLLRPKLAENARKEAKRVSTRMPGLYGPHQMEINEVEITSRWSTGSSTHKWQAVTSIVETEDHVLFELNHSSGMVLAKKKISSGDLNQFVNLARSFYGKQIVGKPVEL